MAKRSPLVCQHLENISRAGVGEVPGRDWPERRKTTSTQPDHNWRIVL